MFGPQTGYFTPQLLTEQAVVGPGIRARGVSFAGTSLVVELGRGVDYAWSATSAGSDIVDTVVERLCDPAGGKATVQSDGLPRRRDVRADGQAGARGDGDPERSARRRRRRTGSRCCAPGTASCSCARRSRGKPVAIVLQRSTYGREVDSVLGFGGFGNPDYVQDADSFRKAAAAIDYTFNWFYVDDQGHRLLLLGPAAGARRRTSTADLPRWGDAKYDWQGWLPAREARPQQINPPSGYLV